MSRLKRQLDRMSTEPSEDEVWHAVELARHQERPYTLDYVERICEDFVELHGDRSFADDPAIVAGLARIDGARSSSSATRRAGTSASGRTATSA